VEKQQACDCRNGVVIIDLQQFRIFWFDIITIATTNHNHAPKQQQL